MAFCPCCDNDGWHEETYSPEHDPDAVRVYKKCSYCSCETEGYWTTWSELGDPDDDLAIRAEARLLMNEDDDLEDTDD